MKALIKYKITGSSLSLPAHGWVGARATSPSFILSVPPPARKKFWLSNQAGEKEGGWGEGIFARLFCTVGAVGWEAFPPSWYQDIKAKQFSNPFKRKKVARKNKELKGKLFCFARRVSAGGEAGAGVQIIRADFARTRVELCSAIATNQDILKMQRRLVARSPRLRRVSLRKKPCPPALFQLRRVNISGLNQRGGQIQIQFFGKANGGSACEARNKQSLFPIFSVFFQRKKYKVSFLIPRFFRRRRNGQRRLYKD